MCQNLRLDAASKKAWLQERCSCVLLADVAQCGVEENPKANFGLSAIIKQWEFIYKTEFWTDMCTVDYLLIILLFSDSFLLQIPIS